VQGEREQRTVGGHERRTLAVFCATGEQRSPGLALSERGNSGRLTVMRLCPKGNPRILE
jgi:hypothetical protein